MRPLSEITPAARVWRRGGGRLRSRARRVRGRCGDAMVWEGTARAAGVGPRDPSRDPHDVLDMCVCVCVCVCGVREGVRVTLSGPWRTSASFGGVRGVGPVMPVDERGDPAVRVACGGTCACAVCGRKGLSLVGCCVSGMLCVRLVEWRRACPCGEVRSYLRKSIDKKHRARGARLSWRAHKRKTTQNGGTII